MYRPSRPPFLLILGILLPAMLVLGIWLGGHPSVLPEPVRDTLVADTEGRLIDEALDIIERDFYKEVDRRKLANESVKAAVEALDDRFSTYFDPATFRRFLESTQGEFSGVGLTVAEAQRGLVVREVFDGSPAKRAGIRSGDVIVEVDGRSIAGKSSEVSTALIKGEPGTTVALTLERADGKETKRVERARVEVPVVESNMRRQGGRRIAQVRLSSFTSGSHGALRGEIDQRLEEGAEGLVLDLRGNGGGLLNEAVLVSSIFVPDGTVVSTRGRSRPERVLKAAGSAIDEDVPVAVLVDRGSASASEIVAGALQDRDRGQVVGTETFGKGVFQEIEQLSNGGALDITVGQYYTPNGTNLGGRGIRPDVEARDDRDTPQDEALRAALRTVSGELR
jgi:carboxyl-terminal processing protease